DINWVEQALDRRPNMHADIAARVPEIGRHDPAAVRRLFTKHQDRILFATDFMVYDRLILGSGGSGPGPSDDDALTFFQKHWRWFETPDRNFAHMTPIQGGWTIDAIDLPDDILRKIYFDNARKLLVHTLPPPRTTATKTAASAITLDGQPDEPEGATTPPRHVESQITTGASRPPSGATARILWTDTHLLVAFSAPYQKLTTFADPGPSERDGLWNRDVVEIFVTPGETTPSHYFEYEVAPTGEKLDLRIEKPNYDLAWNGNFTASAHIDDATSTYTAELKIPFADFGLTSPPEPGAKFRLNLYRHDVSNNAFVAWNPTASRTAHRPDRFGHLTLTGSKK
ncbi:MAG: carbohydrate-binding family 9-like protein, partial [Verrucomicrobiales bacterium]|nr:carbohydrate-binding family 9-like protein [Verrucomicrobiales bacterium]